MCMKIMAILPHPLIMQRQATEATMASSSAPSTERARASAPADSGGVKSSTLPEGFFSDKVADAKARGEKIPDEKDKSVLPKCCISSRFSFSSYLDYLLLCHNKYNNNVYYREDEFQQFQRMMEEQIKDIASKEAEEAEEEADYREEREAYEQL